MTGAAFDQLSLTVRSPDVIDAVLRLARVFARTSPLQKAHIVSALKCGGDNTVGMCGDGSNDCGALKTADAGISISDGTGFLFNHLRHTSHIPTIGEAAIAAPFTASSVTSVKHLLLEGRCALATSFALFKFMIMYSVVQFVGVIICYVYLNLFADLQFLWVDLFLILPLSFVMGLTGPVANLTPSRPPQVWLSLSLS
jgi:cation-transporting ATPase 13A2